MIILMEAKLIWTRNASKTGYYESGIVYCRLMVVLTLTHIPLIVFVDPDSSFNGSQVNPDR